MGTSHPSFLDPEDPDEDDDETGYTWDFDNVYPLENFELEEE